MKISGGGSVKPASSTGSVQDISSSKQSSALGPVAPSVTSDTVKIDPISSQLQRLEQILNDVPVLDSARVEAIKQAITEGRFRVDSDVVADKLLASVREFLLAQQKS